MEIIKDFLVGVFILISILLKLLRVPIILFIVFGIMWVIRYYTGGIWGLLFLIPIAIYGAAELGKNFRKGA
jgi:hypothetical protein